jgi:hypothetical protein
MGAEDRPERRLLARDLVEFADGRLEVSLDDDLSKPERVDWVLAMDWLASRFGAVFHRATECPVTAEWFVELTAPDAAGHCAATLIWSDFPDELSLRAASVAANGLVLAVRSLLVSERALLGSLATMEGSLWRARMRALGAAT